MDFNGPEAAACRAAIRQAAKDNAVRTEAADKLPQIWWDGTEKVGRETDAPEGIDTPPPK